MNPAVGPARAELEAPRQLRTVRNLATVRWAAIVWAAIQVLTYYLPYPPGVFPWAMAAVGVLLVGNTAVWLGLRRAGTDPVAVRRLALASVLTDGIAIVLLVYVYTFDVDTAIWATLYIVPLGAAALFQLRGALWTMAAVTVLYTVREIYGHLAFDNELLPVSITFRMGVGFIIAAFAGVHGLGTGLPPPGAGLAEPHHPDRRRRAGAAPGAGGGDRARCSPCSTSAPRPSP